MPRGRHGMHGSTATRVPTGHGHPGPDLDHPAGDLVAQHEGERAQCRQGGRRAGVVGEEVEVAAADPAGGDRHAGPPRSGQLGLGQIDQRRRKGRVGHVELDGAHPVSVGRFSEPWPGEGRARGPVRAPRMPAVRVPDASLDEVRDHGFTLVEGFLAPDELRAAQQALWLHFPKPEEYFADPADHPRIRRGPVRRRRGVPVPVVGSQPTWPSTPTWSMPPSAISGTADLHLYKVELWAKYGGAADYDQPLHRDYGSHSLVVPRPDGRYQQLTTFIFLSDVTGDDGPTRIVPFENGQGRALHPALPRLRRTGRARGAAGRAGREPARVPDRHPAPRLEPHRCRDRPGSRSWPTTRSGGRPGAGRWPGPSSHPNGGPS